MAKKSLETDKRVYILIGIVISIILIYIAQLFNLQIISSDYKEFAAGNAFLNRIIYPQRGVISDRNDNLLVINEPTYDIVYIPKEVKHFDTLSFIKMLDITVEELRNKFEEVKFLANGRRNPAYSNYSQQTLMTQLTTEDVAKLHEKLYQFPGFDLQKRFLRKYNYSNAGLLLGYVAEYSAKQIEADKYYRSGDYGGKTGIEASYEKHLRGEKGAEILLRDARGRIKGKYEDGKLDKGAIGGKNIKLSLDIELQAYGERLMENLIGAIVMIEPSTGEILAMVSAPSYDPALLKGRNYGKNYLELEKNPRQPLFNRAMQGAYPPGSTFKVPQGAVFLQEGAVTKDVSYPCAHGYIPLGGRPGCHGHASPVSMVPALATSCNAYFPYGLTNMLSNRRKYKNINEAYDVWAKHMHSFGFGERTGVDIPAEQIGNIPTSAFYKKALKTDNWKAANIISIAIGQGEIMTTPLQMANFAATVANKGYFYTPHIVKEIDGAELDEKYTEKRYTTVNKANFDIVAQGMEMSVKAGTSWRCDLDPDFTVYGKTGTVQNPHGHDHSMWMGYASSNGNPKIAIFVAVENATWGSTTALPIARLMLQKYLRGEVPELDKIMYEQPILNMRIDYSYYDKKAKI